MLIKSVSKKFRAKVAGDNHAALGPISHPPRGGVVTLTLAALWYLVGSTLPQALTARSPGNSIPMPRETILADAYLMPKASRTP